MEADESLCSNSEQGGPLAGSQSLADIAVGVRIEDTVSMVSKYKTHHTSHSDNQQPIH